VKRVRVRSTDPFQDSVSAWNRLTARCSTMWVMPRVVTVSSTIGAPPIASQGSDDHDDPSNPPLDVCALRPIYLPLAVLTPVHGEVAMHDGDARR